MTTKKLASYPPILIFSLGLIFIWIYGFTCNFSHHLGATFFNPISVLLIMIGNLLSNFIYSMLENMGVFGYVIRYIFDVIIDIFVVADILIISFATAYFLNKIYHKEKIIRGYAKKNKGINIYKLLLILFLISYNNLFHYLGFSYRFESTELIGISEIVAIFSFVMFFLSMRKERIKRR